jgi:tetratricopeptide (TPR) repeat protein/anti-sigma regulatory factor (Ser/Thr protein kinase)
MNRTIIILCLATGLLLAGNSYGQKQETSKKGTSSKFDDSKSSRRSVKELLKEANDLKDRNPAEALDNVEEALGISIARQDKFNEAKCYVLLGKINEDIQEWKLALANYASAYQNLSTSYTSTPEYLSTLQGLGNTNLKLGLYEESLKYLQQGLALKLSAHEKNELLLTRSEVYYQMGNYTEALNLVDGIHFNPKIYDPSQETRVQNQKAKIYARMNDLDKTKNVYGNSLNTLRSGKNVDPKEEESLQETKEEIVDVLRGQKRYDDEIALRNQSVEYNAEKNNFGEVTKDKVEISKTLDAKGETTAALKEIEEAALIADTLDNPKEQANAFLTLADLYEKNGKNNQALSAYKRYSEAIFKVEEQREHQLLEKSTLIKKQRDIEEFTKDVSIGQREETIERATVVRQQLTIYGLLFIILIIVVTSYFIYKNAQASKVANQLLALKSLRSQMNPHFIFNALNSVNHFIAEQDERTANKFLSEFSQLMRLVLENSQEDFIPLYKEQEILSLYLKLEHYRFRDKFDYEIESDADINTDAIEVPPMLIQPYIENAVWHGLRYKETKGKLLLRFYREPGNLVVEITDNGIGRKRSAELKTENQKKHTSTGLKNIQERLSIINKVYHANYRVSFEDLQQGTGTSVRIYLPINHKMNDIG